MRRAPMRSARGVTPQAPIITPTRPMVMAPAMAPFFRAQALVITGATKPMAWVPKPSVTSSRQIRPSTP
jgi:hypothetical protein